jgi:hypothetical protein
MLKYNNLYKKEFIFMFLKKIISFSIPGKGTGCENDPLFEAKMSSSKSSYPWQTDYRIPADTRANHYDLGSILPKPISAGNLSDKFSSSNFGQASHTKETSEI